MNPHPLKRLFGPYFELPRGIWALFTAILVNRAGTFVYPFLTLYLTQKAGYTPAETGFFIMLLPLAVIPALLLGGWLADHWGRRRVLVVGQGLSGSVYLVAATMPSGAAVPFLMIAATFFSNLAQVGHNAMLNDLTNAQNRKTAFSLNYLGINLGFSVGPLVAGYLFSADLGLFFLVDGLTTLVSAAVVLLFTRETLGTQATGPLHPGEAVNHHGVFRALAQRPAFLAFLGISVLVSAVYSQHTFSLPLQLTHDFGAEGARIFGSLMAINGLTVVLASTVLTRVTGRWPSLGVVAFSAVLYGLGFGALGLVADLPGPAYGWLVATTVVWTLGEILGSVGGHVFQTAHTPQNHRGRFSSVRMVVQNGAQAVTSALTGVYIGALGVTAVWPATAAVSGVAVVALWSLHRKVRKASRLDA